MASVQNSYFRFTQVSVPKIDQIYCIITTTVLCKYWTYNCPWNCGVHDPVCNKVLNSSRLSDLMGMKCVQSINPN